MEISNALKRQYVGRRMKDLEDCSHALEQKNVAFFIQIGHQLKGNAVTYGFPELGAIGARLEESAQFENWEQIALYAAQFRTVVQSLPKYPSE